MMKKYTVQLTDAERMTLDSVIRKGKTSARTIRRAHTLLQVDAGATDATVATILHISPATVQRTRQQYGETGLDAALTEKPRVGRPTTFDARQEAYIVATACRAVPDGDDHWTVRLLAAKAVEMGLVESVSPQTITTTLKKTCSNHGKSSNGASPVPIPRS